MHAWNPHQSGRKKRFRSVLILWQTTRDEQRYLAGSVRVHVRKHSYNITGAWADLKISIHSDRTTTHAEKADAIDLTIRETERDKAAPWSFYFAHRQHLGVVSIQQLVPLHCIHETQKIPHCGVTAAG
jgi:hypothetical protein